MKAKLCVYCGGVATTRDHVVPYLYAGKFPGKRRGGSDPGITVPACKTCNSALGSKLFYTMEDRVAWVRRWRQHRLLPTPATGEPVKLPARNHKRISHVPQLVPQPAPPPVTLQTPVKPPSAPPDKAVGLAAIFL
jgi:5-methylcytosine-specific restriction endonuclease McrA